MGLLNIVDEEDNVVGESDFIEAHEKGLRHRSVQVFVFEDSNYMSRKSKLLVAQLSKNRGVNSLKLGPSAGGHVKKGQSYFEAAREELIEELFYDIEFPEGLGLNNLCSFKNDSKLDGWRDNKENSVLFATNFQGPFSPNPDEIEDIFWESPWN